jgi:hypothetical protein
MGVSFFSQHEVAWEEEEVTASATEYASARSYSCSLEAYVYCLHTERYLQGTSISYRLLAGRNLGSYPTALL